MTTFSDSALGGRLTVLLLEDEQFPTASRKADDALALGLADHDESSFRLLVRHHDFSVLGSVLRFGDIDLVQSVALGIRFAL